MNEEDVKHDEGRFLKISQNDIENCINDPRTAAFFMRKIYIPFVKTYDKNYAIELMMSPSKLSEQIEKDTRSLARRLCGNKQNII